MFHYRVMLMHRWIAAGLAAGALLHAADFAGTYSLRNMREAGSELLLKPNGTFEYMFAYGAADYWAKGTWRADNDAAVILTSDPGKGHKPFRLIRSSGTDAAAVQVRVVAANGRAVPNIDVMLVAAKGRASARTDSEGVATFEKTPGIRGVEFEIRVYNFLSGVIDVNAAHNDFTFEINGGPITEVRFDGERLKVDKDALLMRNWGGGDREMRYVRGE